MLKKILGALFWATSAFSLISSIANGSFMSDRGSAAATYGAFTGTLLSVILNVSAGNFLMTFDEVYKKSYIEGFKIRKKQCSKIVLFFAIYACLFFVTCFVTFFSVSILIRAGMANSPLSAAIMMAAGALPYFISATIFVLMLSYYASPFWSCNKNFKLDENVLNEYLASEDTLKSYANDDSVLANDKVLFLPKLFCAIPFNQISSLKFYVQPIEQGIYINFINGKKIYVATKHFEQIQEAVDENQQTQQ